MTASTRIAGALLATVLFGACGSTAKPTTSSTAASVGITEVRPFSEVQASGIGFEPDPNDPSREILHVTTKVPTICAIVWGPDQTLGRFNNSLSMNGTGITQHDVVLPKVVPGATYTYVIEGITADGNLYRSPVGTFTIAVDGTPTTTPPPEPGTNIATTATVTAFSSEYSADFAAKNAIDGDLSTEWATKGDGNAASITLDLGSATDIKGADFITRSMADGTATTSTYTVSIDDRPALGPFPASTPANAQPAAFSAHGRTITFHVTKTSGGNVGAAEIRVFA